MRATPPHERPGPYHQRIRRFHPATIAATGRLMNSWNSLPADRRLARANDWVRAVSDVYSMLPPTIRLAPVATVGHGCYKIHRHVIALPKVSIVTLLHEFRHAMQYHVTGLAYLPFDDAIAVAEADARAWSLSLYYRTAPLTFTRLVRAGEILHVDPDSI